MGDFKGFIDDVVKPLVVFSLLLAGGVAVGLTAHYLDSPSKPATPPPACQCKCPCMVAK